LLDAFAITRASRQNTLLIMAMK